MQEESFRLELKIEATDYGHVTRVRSDSDYPESASFELTVTRRELAELHESLRAAAASDAFRHSLVQEQLQEWGGRLFDAVFRDDVLERYRSGKREADAAGRELRVQIDLTEIPELGVLPWEYLYDRGRQEYLGLTAGTLSMRYVGLMQRLRPQVRSGPLRALVVIPSPDGYPAIDVQRAWLSLLDQIDYLGRDKRLIVEWLQKPTLFDLRQQLRKHEYHILHFMGHGLIDTTGEGQLLFEDEVGRGRVVGGEHLGSLMRDHFSLRMTILTGGEASHTETPRTIGAGYGFLDVAERLVKRGMGAVIATPFNMPSRELVDYLSRLYADVAVLMSVDRAAARARTALRDHRIWWGVPVLCTRVPDGNVFGAPKSDLEELPDAAEENIAFRLSALRIRTATPDAMARWSDELAESRLKRRIERD